MKPINRKSPPPPCATRSTTLASANRSHARSRARCRPSTHSTLKTPMRTTSRSASLRRFLAQSRTSVVIQTHGCSSLPGGWSQTILEVSMLDVELLASVVTHSLRHLQRMRVCATWAACDCEQRQWLCLISLTWEVAGEVLTNTDLGRSVNNIWEKQVCCVHRKCQMFGSAREKWE